MPPRKEKKTNNLTNKLRFSVMKNEISFLFRFLVGTSALLLIVTIHVRLQEEVPNYP